jgi:hypothetical protein
LEGEPLAEVRRSVDATATLTTSKIPLRSPPDAYVEVIDDAPGRLRLGVIEDASAASLHPFITINVAPGSTLKTDGWSAYPGVAGFKREPHVVGSMAAHVILP